MEIGIYSVTAKSDEKDTLLYKSITDLGMECSLSFITNNKEHLCVVYNTLLEDAKRDDLDGMILVHDDVILECDPRPKLEKLFKEYDLVGVAGTSQIEFKSPALWHLMGQSHLHGAVAHGDENHKHMTSFGSYPHRVVMIDGVFMALNKNLIHNGGGFDEDIPSRFHYYDLSYSLDCHLNGFRVGVGDIPITHSSPGLREYSDEWKAGEEYFLKTYAKD